MTNEVYRLTLDHFINSDGERIRLEEPFVVQMICGSSYTLQATCLNSMLERIRDEILRRATEGAQE